MDVLLIWVEREAGFFCKGGWTRGSEDSLTGKSVNVASMLMASVPGAVIWLLEIGAYMVIFGHC